MKVLFVASECTPIAKVGGLGDIIGSLPKALKELGCEVRIVLPKYKIIDDKQYPFQLISSKIKVKKEFVNIYQGFLPGSKVIVYLLENERYFGKNGIYDDIYALKGIKKFLFFSQAVLEIISAIKWFPEIIHCHDWETAIIPLLLKLETKSKKPKTFLTIHNLASQGKWSPEDIFKFLNLKGNEVKSLEIRDKDKDFNILQQGILGADLINTVSKKYSKEILEKENGCNLDKWLLEKKRYLFGILNGIDTKDINPKTNPNIKTNYSPSRLERKIENKTDLQTILKLPKNRKVALISFVGRLDPQKGIDLIIEVLPDLVRLGCQIVILGKGGEKYENTLRELTSHYPKNISAQIKFDSILAQKIYAGADIFLMPSKFEPCGLGQMIAMRYGTIPIVRETGGLAETVKNKKTGFVFKEYKKEALLKSLKEALESYRNKDKWKELVKNVMVQDFSWQKSAKKYLELYKRLLNV